MRLASLSPVCSVPARALEGAAQSIGRKLYDRKVSQWSSTSPPLHDTDRDVSPCQLWSACVRSIRPALAMNSCCHALPPACGRQVIGHVMVRFVAFHVSLLRRHPYQQMPSNVLLKKESRGQALPCGPATHRQTPLALCRVLEPAGLGPKADAAVGAGGDLRPEQLRGQPRDVPASPREHQVLTWPSIQAIHPYPMSSRCTVLGVHSCPWPGSWLAVAYWHACGTVSVLLPVSYDVPLPSAAARGSS